MRSNDGDERDANDQSLPRVTPNKFFWVGMSVAVVKYNTVTVQSRLFMHHADSS